MRISHAVGIVATILVLFLVGGCATLVQWELKEHLGSKPYANTLQTAENENWQALDAIKTPQILIDIPASDVVPVVTKGLNDAISNATTNDGWKIAPEGGATVKFISDAIQASQALTLSNLTWGSVTLQLTVNAIPHLTGSDLVIDTAIADVQMTAFAPLGIYFPGFVDSDLTTALDGSLDSLNSLMPSKSFPATLPPQLVRNDLAKPAILVTPAAITVMLGSPGGSRAQGTDYTNDYLAVARELQPGYQPGSGIIAAIDKTQDLSAAADQLRAQATAANLAVAQALLRVPANADPATLGPDAIAASVLVSASSDWVTGQLHQFVIDAIAKFHSPEVELVVPAQNVTVKMIDGALEASAAGTARLLNGTVSVQFSVVVWAVVQPSADGLQASYALRELKINNVSVDWDGRIAGFNVPFESALGSVAAQFIGTLPTSDLPIPSLPLTFKAPNNDTFKVVFAGNTTTSVAFTGRAVLLSPRRIDVLTSPRLAGQPPVTAPPPPPPAPDQYGVLDALMTKVETLLDGSVATKQLELLAAKPALGALLESLFTSLNPHIEATISQNKPFDAGRIKVIPGEAACNTPCKDVSTCGNIGGCTINVCNEVVTGTICSALCPPLLPGCSQLCRPVQKLVCHNQSDNDCLNRVTSCTSSVGLCTASWATGLAPTCHAALATLNAAGLNGLVELSGSYAWNMSGETDTNARLSVAADLSSLALSAVGSGQGAASATALVTWIQVGNLLLCPSGNLSVQSNIVADSQPMTLQATVGWTGGGTSPLVGVVTPGDLTVNLHTPEPPLQTLVNSNPALLTCAVGQTIVGLAIVSKPHITQDLLADALRSGLGDRNGPIAAAIVDGRYSYTGSLSPFQFEIPVAHLDILGGHIDAMPDLKPAALTMSTAN